MKEGDVGLASHGTGQKRFARARWPQKQDTFGNARPDIEELLWIAQKFNDLFELFFGLLRAGDVVKGDFLFEVGRIRESGLALPERHGAVVGAGYLAHQKINKSADDKKRQQKWQDISEKHRSARRALGFVVEIFYGFRRHPEALQDFRQSGTRFFDADFFLAVFQKNQNAVFGNLDFVHLAILDLACHLREGDLPGAAVIT